MDEQGMRARIQQLIEHQHMNRQSFAEHIGVSPASLSQILNDKHFGQELPYPFATRRSNATL